MTRKYLSWNTLKLDDLHPHKIDEIYSNGYLATRIEKGTFTQTRSLRIDLDEWKLNSENRRILKKNSNIHIQTEKVPFKDYHWQIGKMAKDFYETRFGKGIMSAQKIKEILTDKNKSNFNLLLNFYDLQKNETIGYAICLETDNILHYSYPFYNLNVIEKSVGLGMMTMAIDWAFKNGKKYVYLGSLQRPTDTYKLQFENEEWFDGKSWHKDIDKVKNILKSTDFS